MVKTVRSGDFKIHYTEACNAFVFDEKKPNLITFHDAPMKAVDVMAECENFDYYVEIKDFNDPKVYAEYLLQDDDVDKTPKVRLRNILKYKFRDTYLYRHAEDKIKKPIIYIVLSTLHYKTNFWLQRELRNEIPVGKPRTLKSKWSRTLLESCYVVDIMQWNKHKFFDSRIEKIKSVR